MLKMRKMGHFLARNELFLIFLEHPSLEFFDFLHKVRQLCLFYIQFVLKNSNYTQNEQKEMCAFWSETTKILFSQKKSSNRFFFFMKVGSNNWKNMMKQVFKKNVYYAQNEENGAFLGQTEMSFFFIFLEHPSSEFFDFLHLYNYVYLSFLYFVCFEKIKLFSK